MPLAIKKAKGYKPKVVAAAGQKPAEILIHGPIGNSYWSDDGITGKDFTDALNAIPVGTPVIVGINSQGGAVGEGMAIYNAIERRQADVTCRIDGYAISIASFLALAGSKVVSPKSSIWMIHNAWSYAQGNADEMRQTGDMLDTHDDVLVAAYVLKTGKSEKEVRDVMAAETWLSGSEAVEWGLADEETETEADLESLDFSGVSPKAFRNIPVSCPKLLAAAAANLNFPLAGRVSGQNGGTPQNSAASGGGAAEPTHIMNRKRIIALLKKHGIQFAETATDEELCALLEGMPAPNANQGQQTQSVQQGQSGQQGQGQSGQQQQGSGTGSGTQTGAQQTAATIVVPVDFLTRFERMEARDQSDRANRVTIVVDQCISECRIPAAQRKSWIDRAVKDETVLDDLRAMPQNLPGQAPVSSMIEIKSEAILDIANHFKTLSEPRMAFVGGRDIEAKEIYSAAIATAIFYRKHAERLSPVMNTNTIPNELKRQVILQQIMRAYAIRIISLQEFSTVFQDVPLEGTNKVEVPFYDLKTTASVNFDQATGYTFQDSTTAFREVEVDRRKYQGLAFNSAEMRRQPYLNQLQIATMASEKLGVDVFTDVASIITEANYGEAVKEEVADAFGSNDIIDIKTAANQSMWPEVGRSLVLDSAYDGNLQKDNSIKSALNFGGTEVIRGGKVPNIFGFNYYENPSIPDNGEGLNGWAAFKSAILVATAPILPAPGVRKVLVNYEVVIQPEVGIAFEYRYWGEAQPDSDFEVIECNYGFGKGNEKALKRITTPS